MKKLSFFLCLAFAFAVPVLVQAQQCGSSLTTSTICNSGGIDYELWNQNNVGTVRMNITGSGNNGSFNATWSGTQNVLFRSGKKWGANSSTTYSQLGNITLEFEATWQSGDNVKMLGVYGWAYYPQGQNPTRRENNQSASFSNQIEYYIIQDRGSYNPATSNDLCRSTPYGEATIDGVLYEFRVCDRINQPMLTGNGNFKQFFSIPKNTSSHRTRGTINVARHFKLWDSLGMNMKGPLYEIAMKVESYSGSNGNGNATVSKSILCTGSSCGSGTGNSSSSTGTTTPSSSSSAPAQATTCKTPLITYPTSTVPTDPYTACFKYTNGNCYVCKVSSEGEFEGQVNTCRSAWVWDGTQIESNLTSGYWYQEVTCPAGSSSSSSSITPSSSSSVRISSSSSSLTVSSSSSSVRASSSSSSLTVSSSSSSVRASSSSNNTAPILENRIPVTYFSVKMQSNKALRIEVNSAATVEIFNLKGNKAASIDVLSGAQTVNLDLPSGMYYAKVRGASVQYAKFVLK